jgi:hypothetical protein
MAVVRYMRLLVVVEMKPCRSGMNILSLIESITRCEAGVQITSAMSVLMPTETVAKHLLLESRTNTFNFKSLDVSSISLGNGMPSSFGHFCSSQQLFSSICSRVTVSELDQFGVVRMVVGF